MVVQLGRACRNLANLKVRQPLSRLLVRGARFDAPYGDLAKDELNVKEVVFTDDPAQFNGYLLKPQLRVLGPKYGKQLGQISKALAESDGTAAVAALIINDTFDKTALVNSTDEVATNQKWIDGKPIYRKVFEVDNTELDSELMTQIPLNIDSPETMTNLQATIEFGTSTQPSIICIQDIRYIKHI